ncbi:hypothetical protein F3Y22_tig00111000pilonHSYRG00022 [Hibiscus syriacus]|uniref:Uncharacterized protein n=1 Tax=Hibiscus syriacus TaxID=106335 RepID=A0A6A2Z7Y1_HIBSY|nr:hypothetical protein F3Y22_tig00111000pilonHSYRG00022 [Hibiscus syriacus]
MEIDEDRSDFEKDEEEDDDSVSDLLRDRFRLSAISIAEYEGLGYTFRGATISVAMKPKISPGARAQSAFDGL